MKGSLWGSLGLGGGLLPDDAELKGVARTMTSMSELSCCPWTLSSSTLPWLANNLEVAGNGQASRYLLVERGDALQMLMVVIIAGADVK